MKELIEKINSHISVYYKPITKSTNNDAHILAKNGALDGTVVIADIQTDGRGRIGRKFISNEGGAYFSLIIRPDLKPEDIVLITPAAAVATARVLQKKSGRKCDIKWVNDILINSKKVCGILTEGAFSKDGKLDYAIVGIGINLSGENNDMPEEIRDIADFVFDKTAQYEKAEIIGLIIDEFYRILKDIEKRDFMEEYISRSVILGKEITFIKDGERHFGRVLGIDKNASLEIEEKGELKKIFAGEVSVRY